MAANRLGDLAERYALVADRVQDRAGGGGLDGQAGQAGGVGAVRELAKLADYAGAVAAALRQRGVNEPQATLAAEAGMTVLRVAIQRWANGDDGRDLATIMRDSVGELRAMAARG